MNHIFETHINCEKSDCPVCDGGLDICIVCGLVEGSLTTDCPGYSCWAEKNENVYQGKEDFKYGQWVNTCSPHSPYSLH